MRNYFTGILTMMAITGIVMFLSSKTELKEKTDDSEPLTCVSQRILSPPLPAEMSFAGERVPLEEFDVRERLDRELMVNTYWHSSTLQLFKLSNRYFPEIEKLLKENGVPEDFKYLAVAESGLRNIQSPSKAEGIWQLMSSTANAYGLVVNSEVDERYNIEKATITACKYLKKAKEIFGTWTMAAASYNCGIPSLKKQIDRQDVSSYYELYLNTETARYVFRILAIKAIFQSPEVYGFYLNADDLYKPFQYKEITVRGKINDLSDFAKAHNTNYKMLKIYNPWLRQPYLNNTANRTYTIKIPAE